jgi:hypothetical protein
VEFVRQFFEVTFSVPSLSSVFELYSRLRQAKHLALRMIARITAFQLDYINRMNFRFNVFFITCLRILQWNV